MPDGIWIWVGVIMVICGLIGGIMDMLRPWTTRRTVEKWVRDAKKKQVKTERSSVLESTLEAKKGRKRSRGQHDDDGVADH